jgi:hypothetical protein
MRDDNYRSLSIASVICLITGSLSLLGFLFDGLICFGAISILFGVWAIYQTRKYEMMGKSLASVGILFSFVSLIGAPIWHHVQYESETLPGYKRVSFRHLTAHKDEWQSLVGKEICLKGYVYPEFSKNSDSCVLLSSNGEFRKREAAVMLLLREGERWIGQQYGFAASGRLQEFPDWKPGSDQPRYFLQDVILRKSNTYYLLDGRTSRNDC